MVSEDVVLDRETIVIETSPAWRSSDGSGVARSGGTVRLWLDREQMFVLRYEVDSDGEGSSVLADVIRLDYGIPPIQMVAFTAPADAVELDPTRLDSCRSSSISGTDAIAVPPGYPRPTYVPLGFTVSSASASSGSGCEVTNSDILLRDDGEHDGTPRYIRLRQFVLVSGIPSGLQVGPQIEIQGHKAYVFSNGDTADVVWVSGEIVSHLSSNAVSTEELRRMAESTVDGGRPSSSAPRWDSSTGTTAMTSGVNAGVWIRTPIFSSSASMPATVGAVRVA